MSTNAQQKTENGMGFVAGVKGKVTEKVSKQGRVSLEV